jgi:hypothetical protein
MRQGMLRRDFVRQAAAGATLLSLPHLGASQEGPASSPRIEEILVLHHSHLDIGYTHTQPVVEELQREFVEQALDMMDETDDWPELSKPRWTCETTHQVMKWLEFASEESVIAFQRRLREKRIGISAFEYNTTPLSNAEQWTRQLLHTRYLRQRFGVAINTVNQHDVNGIAWPMADLMLDSGVELLIMAINNHFGGTAAERPAVFRWIAPSGREILVMNGAHYSMFDQLLHTRESSHQRMQQGLTEYLRVLARKKYRHEFLYLSTTNVPEMYDNAPPNMAVARLIRAWNDARLSPRIRYVTPELLLERIRELPRHSLPVYRGDWTDYWAFGVGSSALETSLGLRTRGNLGTIELLQAHRGSAKPPIRMTTRKTWDNLNVYFEHTWGAAGSMNHDELETTTQWILKAQPAYEAKELSEFLLVNELDALAGNPRQANSLDWVLLVNPTGTSLYQPVPIPDSWFQPAKHLRVTRMRNSFRQTSLSEDPQYGPVELAPYSWKKLRLRDLEPVAPHDGLEVKAGLIATPFHHLEFTPETGRVTRLLDKQRSWEVLPDKGQYSFFEFVREYPEELRRTALYNRDLDREKYDLSCWQTDWKAIRQNVSGLKECKAERTATTATLVRRFEAPGVDFLEQRIKLSVLSPLIELEARFGKQDIRTPEAIYFIFPLRLQKDWKGYFNTAGVPVELDEDQLPGACRDWLPVESFAAMQAGGLGATLYCPDSPLVQLGDFHFGRKNHSIPRRENPLLLAWPLNNYFNTNFRASQPGVIRLRYGFRTHGEFEPLVAFHEGQLVAQPVQVHQSAAPGTEASGRCIEVTGDGVLLDHMKIAEDGNGVIIRLVCLGDGKTLARVTLPGKQIRSAQVCTPLEADSGPATINAGAVEVYLEPKRLTSLRLRC